MLLASNVLALKQKPGNSGYLYVQQEWGNPCQTLSECMRTRLSISVAIAICAGSSSVPLDSSAPRSANASEHSNRLLGQCLNKAGIYSREQTRCWFAEMNRSVELTEQAYIAALKRAGTARRRALVASQRMWRIDTDRKCHAKELFGPTFLGAIEMDEYFYCFAAENGARKNWLERQFRGPKARHTNSPRLQTVVPITVAYQRSRRRS